ncbi:unnamed protein product [Caenorhabditis brenneri]
MKYPSKNVTLSNPYFGYIIVLVVTTISVMISGYFYSQVNGSLELSLKMCTGPSDDLEAILHSFEIVSGVSQILITIVYPTLAILLILEMRKAANLAQSRKNSVERTRSAKMILLMTVFYVICSAPCGTLNFFQLFIHGNFVLETFAEYGSVFISILFCLNAMSHTLLNFTMSSRYRDAVKTVFTCRRSKITVRNTGQWVPEESCGYPEDYSLAVYELDDKYEYDDSEGFYGNFHIGTSVFVVGCTFEGNFDSGILEPATHPSAVYDNRVDSSTEET